MKPNKDSCLSSLIVVDKIDCIWLQMTGKKRFNCDELKVIITCKVRRRCKTIANETFWNVILFCNLATNFSSFSHFNWIMKEENVCWLIKLIIDFIYMINDEG